MGIKVNQHYQEVKESYLFAEIAKRIRDWQEKNQDKAAQLIRMGIGDVTLPLPKEVVKALKAASDEMGIAESFHGYGPEQGYDFLREEIQSYYKRFSVCLEKEEIFISDFEGEIPGATEHDCGNFRDMNLPVAKWWSKKYCQDVLQQLSYDNTHYPV